MTIATDIAHLARSSMVKHMPAKYQVINTEVNYWGEILQKIQRAKFLDATQFVDDFSSVSQFTTHFERVQEFVNLTPSVRLLWIEAAVEELPGKIAVIIDYDTFQNGDEAKEHAQKHCLTNSSVFWVCRICCFAKLRYQATIPLRWEWLEYIDQDGRSVGSVMSPNPAPEYFSRFDSMQALDYMQPSMCAFAANLGLYAIDQMNYQNRN